MRCRACNTVLSDYEATVKTADTEEYLDLCRDCMSRLDDELPIIDRPDLVHAYDETIDYDTDYSDSGIEVSFDEIYSDRE